MDSLSRTGVEGPPWSVPRPPLSPSCSAIAEHTHRSSTQPLCIHFHAGLSSAIPSAWNVLLENPPCHSGVRSNVSSWERSFQTTHSPVSTPSHLLSTTLCYFSSEPLRLSKIILLVGLIADSLSLLLRYKFQGSPAPFPSAKNSVCKKRLLDNGWWVNALSSIFMFVRRVSPLRGLTLYKLNVVNLTIKNKFRLLNTTIMLSVPYKICYVTKNVWKPLAQSNTPPLAPTTSPPTANSLLTTSDKRSAASG